MVVNSTVMSNTEGEILRNYLKAQKIGQGELAEKMDMSRQNLIETYLNAEKIPDWFKDELVKKGIKAFDKSILKEEGVMDSNENAVRLDDENLNVMYVPLVDQYAYAGYHAGYKDAEYVDELPKRPWIVDKQYKGDYRCFEVKGDSMEDGSPASYIQGDILLCREIDRQHWQSKLHIKRWNFVIVHKRDGILIKKISEHDTERGQITLHSLNPLYEDTTVRLDDVAQLFNVVKFERSE